MTHFIQPDWPAPSQIRAFSSLRTGGNSLSPYASFNLGFQVEDLPENVEANRQELRKRLKLPTEPLWINQVHGNTVVEALPVNRDKEADASFTRQAGQVCAVMTADCLPILLCDQTGRLAAAIHAGWRGLAKGIIGNTLKTLAVQNQHLLAWLGPAIGPKKFEVGQDVYEIFCAQTAANQQAFLKASANTWFANIYELARLQLQAQGVNRIFGGNYCTYSESDKFFSYRRDQGKTGRMVSLIWIEDQALLHK